MIRNSVMICSYYNIITLERGFYDEIYLYHTEFSRQDRFIREISGGYPFILYGKLHVVPWDGPADGTAGLQDRASGTDPFLPV